MIINLNLENKKIIVIGGGSEAEKRIKSLLNEKCEIIVITSITQFSSIKNGTKLSQNTNFF